MGKNQSQLRNSAGFASFLGLVLAMAVLCYLGYLVMKSYAKAPVKDKTTQEALKEQGIKTSSYQGMVDSTKSRLDGITKQQAERYKEVDGLQ